MLKKIFANKSWECKQTKSNQIPASVNVLKHQIYFKMEQNYFEKVYQNDIKSKGDIQIALVFNI